jgi:hypothetical protein
MNRDIYAFDEEEQQPTPTPIPRPPRNFPPRENSLLPPRNFPPRENTGFFIPRPAPIPPRQISRYSRHDPINPLGLPTDTPEEIEAHRLAQQNANLQQSIETLTQQIDELLRNQQPPNNDLD